MCRLPSNTFQHSVNITTLPTILFNRSQLAVPQSMMNDHNQRYREFASRFDVNIPQVKPSIREGLNLDRIRADSQLAWRCCLSLVKFVQIYRDQTPSDMRSNNDLFELQLPIETELRYLTEQWNAIVCGGVQPAWKYTKPRVQVGRLPNHKSIEIHSQQVREHIAKGQHEGHYLIVDINLLN